MRTRTVTPHEVADALEGPYDGHRVAGYMFMRYPVVPRSAAEGIKGRSTTLGVMCLLAGASPNELQSKRGLAEFDQGFVRDFLWAFPWATPMVRSDITRMEQSLRSTDGSFGPIVNYLRSFSDDWAEGDDDE